MTEPKPPIDALDDNERELARVLRALPGGEPPAALDQKILRAAANAAAASRRPRSRWLASLGSMWGIGGAAAAVLALGITWQMLDPSRPDSFQRNQAAPAASTEDSAVTVDLGEPSQAPEMQAPTQAAPLAEAPASAARDAVAPAAPSRLPSAKLAAKPAATFAASPPPPPPRDQSADAGAAAPAAQVQGPSVNAVDAASVESTTIITPEQFARTPETQDAAHDRAETSAGYLAGGAEAARAKSAPSESKAMTPAVWLAKVRKLRSEGQLGEARNSLELFHQYYPQYVIPADLAPLLRE